MTQIASEDYENLLIYLHADTETQGFNPALMQQEHRERRRLETQGDERKYDVMVTFTGNESVGGGRFTQGLTRLRSGVRIVPYDSGTGTEYNLDILSPIVNVDDGISDRDVFNRSGVASIVNIDPTYSPVEVRTIATGSGLSPEQATMLDELWRLQGLDAASPLTVTSSSRETGDISQTITGDGENTSTVTRI